MPDITSIRIVLPQPKIVRINVGSGSGGSIARTANLLSGDGSGNAVDSGIDPSDVITPISPLPSRPTTLNQAISLLVQYGLCSLLMVGFFSSANGAEFGDIPASLSLGASQSVRRNAGNTAFEAYTSAAVSPSALTKTDDTNVTLTLGGTPATALLQATSLTLGWSGTLAISRGGTGAATASAHTFFANNTGSTGAPSFTSFVAGTNYWDTTVFTGAPTIGLVPSPTGVPSCLRFLDETGTWSCASGGSSGAAPDNAHYLTNQAESGLSAEINLGALSTGVLYQTTSASVATISTEAQLSVVRGGTGASTLTGVVIGNGTSAFTVKTNPSGAFVGDSDTQTLTNKRITPRTHSVTSATSWTPDFDTYDQEIQTALAGSLTINAPTWTSATEGKRAILRIKDDGSPHSISFNGIYRAIGVTLPTTTVASKTLYIGVLYNFTDTKVDVLAVGQEQ